MELKITNGELWVASTSRDPATPPALTQAVRWPMTALGSRNAATLARLVTAAVGDLDAARVKLLERYALCGVDDKPLQDTSTGGPLLDPARAAELEAEWRALLDEVVTLPNVRAIWDGDLHASAVPSPEVMLALGGLLIEQEPE